MKIAPIMLAALTLPLSSVSAQTYPIENGYTILKGFRNSEYEHWVNVVQSEINAGRPFYVNGVVANDRGARTIVNQLGPYYNYVYGPRHHEVPVIFARYQCVWYFPWSALSDQIGVKTEVCGGF